MAIKDDWTPMYSYNREVLDTKDAEIDQLKSQLALYETRNKALSSAVDSLQSRLHECWKAAQQWEKGEINEARMCIAVNEATNSIVAHEADIER